MTESHLHAIPSEETLQGTPNPTRRWGQWGRDRRSGLSGPAQQKQPIRKHHDYLAVIALLSILAAMFTWVFGGSGLPLSYSVPQILMLAVCVRFSLWDKDSSLGFLLGFLILSIGTGFLIADLPQVGPGHDDQTISAVMQNRWAVCLYGLGLWALAWTVTDRVTEQKAAAGTMRRFFLVLQPLFFGAWLLVIWEVSVRVFLVPTVLLPPPSIIFATFLSSLPTLYVDFVQTVVRAVLPGYIIGCLAGLFTALLIDRSSFLRRGLVPLANFFSSLPLVGIAPIAVMWFGFDWPSKVAVVVIMTFFPMLVNMVAGLEQTSRLERDLLRSWAATPGQTLTYLRFPAASPFLFNALKINSTLSLIGAIVAEFFGTPIVGIGFRISSGVGRLDVPLVWAEILLAMICGCAFYGSLALLERRVTFWSATIRGK